MISLRLTEKIDNERPSSGLVFNLVTHLEHRTERARTVGELSRVAASNIIAARSGGTGVADVQVIDGFEPAGSLVGEAQIDIFEGGTKAASIENFDLAVVPCGIAEQDPVVENLFDVDLSLGRGGHGIAGSSEHCGRGCGDECFFHGKSPILGSGLTIKSVGSDTYFAACLRQPKRTSSILYLKRALTLFGPASSRKNHRHPNFWQEKQTSPAGDGAEKLRP